MIICVRFSALKIDDPATRMSAPASVTSGAVVRLIPPSTSMCVVRCCRVISCRSRAILLSWLLRNFCPPNPGSTVMMRMVSNSLRMSKSGSTGSLGRMAKQACVPMVWSWRARRIGAVVAPMWKVMEVAPMVA